MALCALAGVLSIVGLALSAHTCAIGGDYDDEHRFGGPGYLAVIPLPIYALVILFVIAEVAVQAALKFRKGLHPAVHTAMWLICWLVFAAVIIIFSLQAALGGYGEDDYALSPMFIAQFVFAVLLFVVTLILFVLGCIDTRAYNVSRTIPPSMDYTNHQTKAKGYEDRSWRVTKLVMNVMVVVLGIVGFALGLSLLRFHDAYNLENIIFPACAAVLMLPVLWAAADIIYSLTGHHRQYLQGMHPGGHVGVWLISWIALAIIGGILATYSAIRIGDCDGSGDSIMRRAVEVNYLPRALPISTFTGAPTPSIGSNLNTVTPTVTDTVPGPTTTSSIGSDPYGPYNPYSDADEDGDDDSYDDPYGDDPYDPYDSDPYNRNPDSTSPTNSPYSSPYSSPYDSDPDGTSSGSSDSSRYPYNSPYSNPYDRPYRGFHDDDDKRCANKGIGTAMLVTTIFIWLVFVLSFIQFVAGCSDTYLRNRYNPVAVVYVPVAQPLGVYPPQATYASAKMYGSAHPPMAQAPQVPPPARGSVVEYYGTAH